MTFHASIAQICEITTASACQLDDSLLTSEGLRIHTDTRTIQPGDVFLAFRGENFDGHKFVQQALEAGAIAAIVQEEIPNAGPQLLVEDTLIAYQQLGQWWRQQFNIPIIAITGSVGKTTTKELIAAVLETTGPVLKTEQNFNNEIGVPKTLMGLSDHHQFAVVEMGMRGRGEIACLAKIAQPTISVITNVGTAHIGRLGSREAIAEAKCELLAESPKDAIAILNADTPLLTKTAKTVWSGNTITYGLTQGELQGVVEDEQTLIVGDLSFPLPLSGQHNALNYLAAIAIAQHLSLDLAPLHQGITVTLPDGRAQTHQLDEDILLLDESYNAGPESMTAALKLLKNTPGKRKIAVLGPMKELGDHAIQLHQEIGGVVAKLGIDQLLILDEGEEGSAIA
ncbi:MAG: UDP-N-acetylmuramoyl-tripeptide--D-alanyl-D-alanine ligase, partial [Acaryochloridaceae cyanobacterium RL_2_7]|nr:UDP-N-acetylmuramoyl-tripeptide--D-alanyl-D-alanine ligase [Acaryochloridaceae cyanobacterium RL_2_7]